jgi:hypothetical protein
MERIVDTPAPVDLLVENQSGSVRVIAADVDQTRVTVTGDDRDSDAPDVRIEHDGLAVRVIGPRPNGLFRRTPSLAVTVTLPAMSSAVVRTWSADTVVEGSLRTLDVKSGSGDVTANGLLGRVDVVAGSGDVRLGTVDGHLSATTGSGDVTVERSTAQARLKAGSGDVTVARSCADLSVTSGSGDIRLGSVEAGQVRVRAGSGDTWVGIPAGVPVWTDATAGGGVTSSLTSRGKPADGEPYVAVRAQIGSGSLRLEDVEDRSVAWAGGQDLAQP